LIGSHATLVEMWEAAAQRLRQLAAAVRLPATWFFRQS
jgi:hypothetical protein